MLNAENTVLENWDSHDKKNDLMAKKIMIKHSQVFI